jgi:hypothetical protein
MKDMAEIVLGNINILAGIALVEDAYDHIAAIEVLKPVEIMSREPAILRKAKDYMARLPVDSLDALIIKYMGKEISGTGMDTNVIGRRSISGEKDPTSLNVGLIGICDLTKVSGGNALGVGLADITTKRLADKVDWKITLKNLITSTFLKRGRLPPVLPSEKEMLETITEILSRKDIQSPRIMFIRDTLHLYDFYVSEGLTEELVKRDDIDIIEPLHSLGYNDDGTLSLDWQIREV